MFFTRALQISFELEWDFFPLNVCTIRFTPLLAPGMSGLYSTTAKTARNGMYCP